jgi:peptide deformylase
VLRTKAETVKDPVAPEIRTLISEMIATMKAADGVGLAAPQIGRSIRLFVATVNGRDFVFINPVITARSESKIVFEEGCLSLPGQFLPVERFERITVEYDDSDGTRKSMEADGFLAIVIQHEYDHLDGVLITDRYETQNAKKAYAL